MTASLRLEEYIKNFELKESMHIAQVITESCSTSSKSSKCSLSNPGVQSLPGKENISSSEKLKKYSCNNDKLLTVDELLCSEPASVDQLLCSSGSEAANSQLYSDLESSIPINKRRFNSLPTMQRQRKPCFDRGNVNLSLDGKRASNVKSVPPENFSLCPHHRHVMSHCTLDNQKAITSQLLDLKKVLNLIDDLKYDLMAACKQKSRKHSHQQPDANVLDILIQRLSKAASTKENKLCETLQQSFYSKPDTFLHHHDATIHDDTASTVQGTSFSKLSLHSAYFAENKLCGLCESFIGARDQSKTANSTVLTTNNISEVMNIIDEKQRNLCSGHSDSYSILTSSPNSSVMVPSTYRRSNEDEKENVFSDTMNCTDTNFSSVSSNQMTDNVCSSNKSSSSLASESTRVSILTKLIENKPQSIRKFLTECLDKNVERKRSISKNSDTMKNAQDTHSYQHHQQLDTLSSSTQSLQALDQMITTLNRLSYSEEVEDTDISKFSSTMTSSQSISSGSDATQCNDFDCTNDSGSLQSSLSTPSFLKYCNQGKQHLDQTRSNILTLRNIMGHDGNRNNTE